MSEVEKPKSFIKLNDKAQDENTSEEAAVPKKKKRVVLSGSKASIDEQGRGVVYLSHIPHGFYEKQMYRFFSQFGSVTNIKLGRSKKSGASRGYAFIEFRYAEVAKIVAETMNNYLMFEKLVKCTLVPPEKVTTAMFKGKINLRIPAGVKARMLAKKKANAKRTDEQEAKRSRRLRKNTAKAYKELAKLGIQVPSVIKTPVNTSSPAVTETLDAQSPKKAKLATVVETKKKKTSDTLAQPKSSKVDETQATTTNQLSAESAEQNGRKKKKPPIEEKMATPKVITNEKEIRKPPKLNAEVKDKMATPNTDVVEKLARKTPKVNAEKPVKMATPKPGIVEKTVQKTPKLKAEKQDKIATLKTQGGLKDNQKTPKSKAEKKENISTPKTDSVKRATTTPKSAKMAEAVALVKKMATEISATPTKTVQKSLTPKTTPFNKERKSPKPGLNTPKFKSGADLDLSVLLGDATPSPKVFKTQKEKKIPSQKSTPSSVKSPTTVMEVDSDDDEITMKTPPNVKKIKSRSNSRAASKANTPAGKRGKLLTPSTGKGSTPNLEAAALKLVNVKHQMTPKLKKKLT